MVASKFYQSHPEDPEAPVVLDEYQGLRVGMTVIYVSDRHPMPGEFVLSEIIQFRVAGMVLAILNDGEWEVSIQNLRAAETTRMPRRPDRRQGPRREAERLEHYTRQTFMAAAETFLLHPFHTTGIVHHENLEAAISAHEAWRKAVAAVEMPGSRPGIDHTTPEDTET